MQIYIMSVVNILLMLGLAIAAILLGFQVSANDYISFLNNVFYIDSLSVIQLFIISSVSLITSIYSYKYIKHEYDEKYINLRKVCIYYALFIVFVISMVFLAISNNIMAMWIALEATTLSTAFLIGFNNSKLSLEAAWKYIILCSIGIAIGLVGIILFIYSIHDYSEGYMLKWTFLVNGYKALDKDITKLAFTFIFIGIGTKAGLAPMHTWLSDGHSEAPSPISAMMSGILINLAMYVIVRFYIIVRLVNGIENLRYLFIIFGCISLIIAAFSILKQTNYKRLLAFSSVENMGIISLGLGFGGLAGTFGALLHSVIHAYGKSLLFLTAGNVLSAYKTKRMDKIERLIETMPVNSIFLILGVLVITGIPPFASFFSEFSILYEGIAGEYWLALSIYVICILTAFAGFIIGFVKMIFKGENIARHRMKADKINIFPLVLASVFIVFISLTFNNYLSPILLKAVSIICG